MEKEKYREVDIETSRERIRGNGERQREMISFHELTQSVSNAR